MFDMYKSPKINTVRLPKHLSEYVQKIPEDGMGYHVLDIELESGKILRQRMVINSELLLLESFEEIKESQIKSVLI